MAQIQTYNDLVTLEADIKQYETFCKWIEEDIWVGDNAPVLYEVSVTDVFSSYDTRYIIHIPETLKEYLEMCFTELGVQNLKLRS